jgi:cyclic beta-1,2-glucan synthetase
LELAAAHTVSPTELRVPSPIDRIEGLLGLLSQAYGRFVRISEAEGIVTTAAEWLLDNLYLVEQAGRLVIEDMPPGYYRRLPKLAGEPHRGLPRIYAIAREVVRLCDGQVDLHRLTRFVQAYQEVRSLTLGELWALPLMLRVAELELLAQAVADTLGDRLDAPSEPIPAVELPDAPTEEIIVGRAVRALRALGAVDWAAFVKEVSLVESTLQQEPTGAYGRMDQEGRNRYRQAIETLGRRSDRTEEVIARRAVELAERARQEKRPEREWHVGYYLIDRGREALAASIGYRPGAGERMRAWLLRHATGAYLGAILLLTVLIIAGLLWYGVAREAHLGQLVAILAFACVPASIAAVSLVNMLVTHIVPPRVLPKLDLRQGIPPEMRGIVLVPCLFTDADEVDSLLGQLERHYLSNADPELAFGLLSDLRDAPQKHMAGDDALIERAAEGVRALNRRYGRNGRPFFLLHRERQWNPSERVWMGWERKRGKLEQFNGWALGYQSNPFAVSVGDLAFLRQVRYVITLDADTVLPPQSAQRLIGALAHPLNRAQFDPHTGRVVAGYTILQPRTELKFTSALASRFTRIFGSDMGLDLYTRAVSDVYQDLFGEAIYVGKGIYDIAAFYRSLEGRAPENALLSHDLFEGVHGRAGLISDVVLYEDYPSAYLAYTQRLHRWVRGDWQLLPWLLGRVPVSTGDKAPTRLSLLDRWKLLDNLRRSTQQLALLLFLAAGWLILPGSALAWTAWALAFSALPLIAGVITGLLTRLQVPKASASTALVHNEAARWLLSLVFLPYEGLILADAAISTLIRVYITRRKLLQWTTAAHTARLLGRERRLQLLWSKMSGGALLGLALGAATWAANPRALPLALPLTLAWVLSPQVAAWISQPQQREQETLTREEQAVLRRLARRHWRFFEQFIGPEDHWLPPDHFQEEPLGQVGHRTSPTNIGLMLLSTMTAHQLGYLGPDELVNRLRSSFQSLADLKRHRGHWLNWYDTHSLQPLPPEYVSTVDSGNLAGALIALRQSLLRLPQQDIFRWETWQGLGDVLGVLVEIVSDVRDPEARALVETLRRHVDEVYARVYQAREAPERWPLLLTRLRNEYWPRLDEFVLELVEKHAPALSSEQLDALYIWFERVHGQLDNLQDELRALMPWVWELQEPPAALLGDIPIKVGDAWRALRQTLPHRATLAQIPELCLAGRDALLALDSSVQVCLEAEDGREPACEWIWQVAERLDAARERARWLLSRMEELADTCEEWVQEMDFGFLYDPQRQVFFIGYNVNAARMDENHYDLLASEARLASLIAIAKGEAPPSHWLHLERPLVEIGGALRALVSWNGSMFEYLMPELLIRSHPGTLLHESNRAAVQRQMDYARSKGVPWGISESGYYHFDAHQHYQYRGFGVPGLGRKRGLGDDLVIAPYATLLALPVAPRAVLRNIEALVKAGLLGSYGFYEALDYTPGHLPIGQASAIVRSYMVHHQGMSLVSLGNYLLGGHHVESLHADPRIDSVELLLQEGMPADAPVQEAPAEPSSGAQAVAQRPPADPWVAPAHAPVPQVHYLSNGEYGVLINSAGGGYSQWRDLRLTRWAPDVALDRMGVWIYVRDLDSDRLWSTTYQPTAGDSRGQQVVFEPRRAEFVRSDHDIRAQTDVSVIYGQNTEIRRVTLANLSDRPRRLLLCSYGELVLADALGDERHPAFSKLFVQSEYLPQVNGQLYWRRPRAASDQPVHLLHYMLLEPRQRPSRLHEADRAAFVGRGRDLQRPAALAGGPEGLSGSAGATLDPIMAVGQVIELDPHGSARLCWVTTVAPAREQVLAAAAELADLEAVERALENAREQGRIELANLGVQGPELAQMQGMLSLLLYPHPMRRAERSILAGNTRGQSRLWPYAISGDYPIALVQVNGQEDLALVRRMLVAHEFWRRRGLLIDLVLLNERGTSYAQESQNMVLRLIASRHSRAWVNRRGGIFSLCADQMEPSDRALLYSAARVILAGGEGVLRETLEDMTRWPSRLPLFGPRSAPLAALPDGEPIERPKDLLFDNGYGGFTADGREYATYLEPGKPTPAPWSNVIANPQFGFVVSETGGGYSWHGNSGENRLTAWRNDPVTDMPAEALYMRDEDTGQIWSPTPLPTGAAAPYLVRHGAGYTHFEHNSHSLGHELTLYVAPDAPVKIVRLRLHNSGSAPRRLTATYYAEWVLGTLRSITQQYIVPEYDGETHSLLARNPYNPEYPEAVAFLATDRAPLSLTADRVEFLGRNGSLEHPAGLGRSSLEGAIRAGDDPCAAMQVAVDLASGATEEVVFLLGQAESRPEALELVRRFQSSEACDTAWAELQTLWDGILGAVTVRTPEPSMDLLLNRWLLYQALSSRIWGRSGLYQSSGAYGYRDQLQDVMALMHSRPDLAREQILRAARHQFEEGDVLHWWHPPSGRGVRTRISDDLLWLPLVTAHYVDLTGDAAILDEQLPFLSGEPLDDGQEDRYGLYEQTEESYSLFEHCNRAMGRGATEGRHSLPLMGGGDWNDGMNRVGIHGQGESIWLGWFLYAAMLRFAALCARRGEQALAQEYQERAARLLEAIEAAGWDGEWYRRAYYDDGTPLGSRENNECQIDSIAQSWAVLGRVFGGARLPNKGERIRQAMQALDERLVREEDRLLLLFTPPFDRTPRDPGYIKGYLPGIRENGGQYTHAALWAIWALAELGQGERAEALFRMINPILRADGAEGLNTYRVEPYVISADVYGVAPHVGRGGWTWYTGSASWMYRLGLEGLLGLHRRENRLWFEPHLPAAWDGFEVTYRYGAATYRIEVVLGAEASGLSVDGEPIAGNELTLHDDGREHRVLVRCARIGDAEPRHGED